MLSYRHAFHAGNHADVLKHTVQLAVLDYLLQKDKPLWYIDTHAGAGLYRLDKGHATRLAEHEEGIGRLDNDADAPPIVRNYLDAIAARNPPGALRLYPGSAILAAERLRPQDRAWLYELHPTDVELLQKTTMPWAQQLRIEKRDGLEALKALLPPSPRRAMIMIDPPFELDREYRAVPAALEDALKRFATGTYLVWYPLLARTEQRGFLKALRKLDTDSWLDVQLCVRDPAAGRGMFGSGIFVVNPPYTLAGQLEAALPYLKQRLGLYGGRTLLEHS